jgi:hypothetical protein
MITVPDSALVYVRIAKRWFGQVHWTVAGQGLSSTVRLHRRALGRVPYDLRSPWFEPQFHKLLRGNDFLAWMPTEGKLANNLA